jgi:hypothetical protein
LFVVLVSREPPLAVSEPYHGASVSLAATGDSRVMITKGKWDYSQVFGNLPSRLQVRHWCLSKIVGVRSGDTDRHA